MGNLGAVRDGLREAWRFRWPLTVAHLATRLLLTAIIAPFAAAILRLGISFSDQTALTDQDIALLLLSPIGLTCALVVASMLVCRGRAERRGDDRRDPFRPGEGAAGAAGRTWARGSARAGAPRFCGPAPGPGAADRSALCSGRTAGRPALSHRIRHQLLSVASAARVLDRCPDHRHDPSDACLASRVGAERLGAVAASGAAR